ncbi:MAG TPA: lytic transglycosylase domain-containing protein, partial [Abditibacteriaceae bacterium]
STTLVTTRPTVVASLPYDQLRKSYRVEPRMTLAAIRADAPSHSGRVIEIAARVSGLMSTPAGRTAILEADGGTVVIAVTSELNGVEHLRAGKAVRALLLAGLDHMGDASFKPLALTDKVDASMFRAPFGGTQFGEATEGPANLEGLTIVPPMTDTILPRSTRPQPMTRPGIVGRSAPSSPAPISSDFEAGDFNAQKASYVAIARRFNRKLTAAQSDEIATAILNASRRYAMDPRFLASIIAVESGFDIYCLSSSGAMGLGQLMPFNLKPNGVTNAWNPTQNIFGAAKMLHGHLSDYRSRPDATLLAVAAYNAGPGAVRRAGYKVPNGQQVQRYVWKVYNQYKAFAPELFAER